MAIIVNLKSISLLATISWLPRPMYNLIVITHV